MVEIIADTVKDAENCVRDIKNWLAVFKTEYELPDEIINKIDEKMTAIAEKMGVVTCKITGETVEASDEELKAIEDIIRDVKNWVAVFKTEYEQQMKEEAVNKLNQKLEELAIKAGNIKCI